MGSFCPQTTALDIDFEIIHYKDLGEEIINENKYIVKFAIKDLDDIRRHNKIFILEVIHVDTVDSTMPASRQYIDEGNKFPFIYNTKIQTHGKGKGDRKWSGSIDGNIYTSSSIPINMVKNEISSNEILVKITAISIIQKLRNHSKDQFFLKYPNDIICVDKRKLGGIIVELYKDFYIIGFGINIVKKPDQNEMRKEGLSPCCVNEHLHKERKKPQALDLSVEITKQIIYNLKLSLEEIDNLFDKYAKK